MNGPNPHKNLPPDLNPLLRERRMQVQLLNAVFLAGALFLSLLSPAHSSAQEFEKSTTWDWRTLDDYNTLLLSYLDQKQLEDPQRQEAIQQWQALPAETRGPELLEHLLTTAGKIEPRIAAYNTQLRDPGQRPDHPQELEWLTSDVPGWMQDSIRLACGRAYAQRQLYDEALEMLIGLDQNQVCDPSALIFYRAVCEHHLLKQEECLKNLDMLLERADEVPVRFVQVSKMMRADIESLESDSLDEVARMMRDVERRLDLGRAGKRVRDEEQEIADKLNKMIEKIEQQQQEQQQQQQQQAQQSQQQQQKPMDDSRPGGDVRGPGDTKQKGDGDRAGWGNLPPAQRQEALQRLTEDLPSHYRDVIEGYFRQLSQDK